MKTVLFIFCDGDLSNCKKIAVQLDKTAAAQGGTVCFGRKNIHHIILWILYVIEMG
jgi:hypothetical protein